MNKINYDINSKETLMIGYQEENNSTSVKFNNFKKDLTNSSVYLMIDRIGLFPLTNNNEFSVTYTYTKKNGSYQSYLVELNSTGSFIKKSDNFIILIKHSPKLGKIAIEQIPKYDNWFSDMSDLYYKVKGDYESGKFKGEKGDIGEQGKQGLPGIVVPSDGMYSMMIKENDLYIVYNDVNNPPSVYLDENGHLIFGEKEQQN